MKELPKVTLICIDCVNPGGAIGALLLSLKQIKPAETFLLTDVDIKVEGIETIKIPSIKSKKEYSEFVIKELNEYFVTDFVLLIQADGYVINADAWDDEFLNNDFIGAPWLYTDNRNVGNGGVSIRSQKLQWALSSDDFIKVCDPEDECIGRLYRNYLEETHGIKFASEELADKFSYELREPKQPTFAFHGKFHKPYQKTVVINRTGAMGDVICAEPILAYFHTKGYRVILETLPQFKALFYEHYFPIHFKEEVDQRVLEKAEAYNLDLSYEMKPKELHQKTYFEFCGVSEKEMQIRKPKLSLSYDPKLPEYKLFKKYAVIHYDIRAQNGRNIHGVEWDKVCEFLLGKGYVVIQIGKGEHPEIKGAIFMNTPSEPFLLWLIGGADLMISGDSGPSHIAVAMDVPSVIFFGSVNPNYIHADISMIRTIEIENPCSTPKCWHNVIGCEGQKCIVDENKPPCVQFSTESVIKNISYFIN